MERKLIKQGLGGLTVYLPKKWLDNKGLKEGQTVDIVESDSALIIQGRNIKDKEITLEIAEDNVHHLRHILTHVYRKGFNKVVIVSSLNISNEVSKLTSSVLLGFEVTKKSSRKIIIENISEPSEGKYEVMLRKIFLVIRETQSFLKENNFSLSKKHLDEITELRDQSDKFILFCKRLLTKDQQVKNILLEWELLTFLMHIQHAYFYFYECLSRKRVVLNKHIKDFLSALEDSFSLLKDAYYKQDDGAINKINFLKKKKQNPLLEKALESSKKQETVVWSYLKEISRIIQLSTSPILSKNLLLKNPS